MELNKENYYSLEANRHYMSVSQFKSFLPAYGGCEAATMAELSGEYKREPIEAFLEGHYLHAWNEGTLKEFKFKNPDIYAKTGKTAGQLKANFKHCNRMIEVLESDPLVLDVLSGEKEVIFTAELFGIPWKVMLDSYNPDTSGIFADLKSMKEMDGKWWNKDLQIYENFIDHYGYNIQMSVYAEVEKRATKRNEWLLPNMVIITKEDPPDHDIIYFDYDNIEAGLQIVARNIERVKAVKSGKVEPVRCEKCEYCRATKRVSRIKHVSELSLY